MVVGDENLMGASGSNISEAMSIGRSTILYCMKTRMASLWVGGGVRKAAMPLPEILDHMLMACSSDQGPKVLEGLAPSTCSPPP